MIKYILAFMLMLVVAPALAQQYQYQGRNVVTFENPELQYKAMPVQPENIPQPSMPFVRIGEPTDMLMQKLQPAQQMVDQHIQLQKQQADIFMQNNAVTEEDYYAQNPQGGSIDPLSSDSRIILQDMQKQGIAGPSAQALQPLVIPPPPAEEYEYVGRNVVRRKDVAAPAPAPTDLTPAQRDRINQQFTSPK